MDPRRRRRALGRGRLARLGIEGAGPVEMGGHALQGGCGVAGFDGIDDAGMFGEGDILMAGPMQQAAMGFEQPAQHRLGGGHDDGIAGHAGDAGVKADIGFDEGAGIATDAIGLVYHGGAQIGDVGTGGALGGNADDAEFHHLPHFLEMLQIGRGKVKDEPRDLIALVEEGARVDGVHAGAFAMSDGDKTVLVQGLKRLAHGGATDAEPFHQAAFGGKRVTRLYLARQDHVAQTIQHLIRELPADDPIRVLTIANLHGHLIPVGPSSTPY